LAEEFFSNFVGGHSAFFSGGLLAVSAVMSRHRRRFVAPGIVSTIWRIFQFAGHYFHRPLI
jgi:hypothetical protein